MQNEKNTKKLTLRIIAHGMQLKNPLPPTADMVIIHAMTGEMGILPGRLPCNMALGKGALRVYENDQVYAYKINGGIGSVSHNEVTILSNAITAAEEEIE